MSAKELDMPKNRNTKNDSIRKRVVCTSREYASVTTAHGFSYIADENYSGGDRILWIIIVLLAFGFTIFQMTRYAIYLQLFYRALRPKNCFKFKEFEGIAY